MSIEPEPVVWRWRLAEGITVHPMPFGGGFVVDWAQLQAQQIGAALTNLLTQGSVGPETGDGGSWWSADLATQIDAGVSEGWLTKAPPARGEKA